MKQKKNKILRFIFSLLPGAGEMYMGFMKMGLSLMTLFFIIITISAFLRLDSLIFICIIVWFYSFFNVHNIAAMPEEEFLYFEDQYLFHVNQIIPENFFAKINRKILGIFLILVGIYTFTREIWFMISHFLPEEITMILDTFFYNSPRLVIGICIIILGIYLIRGKKKQLDQLEYITEKNTGENL